MRLEAADQIERFREFIESEYQKKLHQLITKGERALVIDFSKLAEFDIELAEDLLSDPEEVFKAAELALEQFDLPEDHTLERVRFKNLPDSQSVRIANIRSSDLGKFIWLEGIVRQASDVRPQVTSAKFECSGCGNTLSILQLDVKFKEPTRCTCGWRGKFKMLSQNLIDVQHLKIEESPEKLDGGEQPKRISIMVREDLVDPSMVKRCAPGSRINVFGIVKEIPIILRTGAQSLRFDLIVEANFIESVQEEFADIILNEEDAQEIKEFSKDPLIFEKFVKAIAPSIFGYDEIKRSLVLQLLGGVRKVKPDGTANRGDIHILLVGDPGSGKSKILEFMSKAAPKARFVSGKGATGAGITASVVKDEFLKGWSLEAGALVLANKGLAVVDELDKMSHEDRSALHEALEQQTVTISKANIQATLRAQTTLLAAANPKFGRFDPYTPIAAQIDLPSTLINRFDLIFPIRDIPSKDKDTKIALHVLEGSHKKEVYDTEVSVEFLRKYISYVKKFIFPTMTKGAITEICNFYVSLRNSGRETDEGVKPIPISARQLEALIRLSEASARLKLSEQVTREDALIAIDLLKHCLMQIGFDPETGQIDIDRISSGISASSRGKIVTIKDIINMFEGRGMKSIPLEDIIVEAATKAIDEGKVYEIIDQLKRSGDIFEPRKGFIQKI